ncbi:8-oxo-dGTP diphosphatase [Pullulanibacillus pueri]|uniref:Putative Nudix hydrolase YvcI n=2 Tax=Pullulanibacillus pueri TaxID=1437324 RepID=A0A8J3EKV8_9BACL|nr:8-oxo-dGTP diphosphatase [Pullulanibacillus pueri]MBM7680232.1 8-oxo-dGTP diphosphatase [Pullulanibacillus pueri]GGH76084.1 putative Nudix hydrolase YvcI [Pullulanibacillus pueri]
MQRVTNCLLQEEDKILLLQKPSRHWWVAPGGKMESGESVKDSVIREFREETGLYLKDPTLKGVFTFVIKNGKDIESEWMMFTFFADHYDGQIFEESAEGRLLWQPTEAIKDLPMAEGDRHLLDYVLHGQGMIFGTFYYTPDFELLSYRLEPS